MPESVVNAQEAEDNLSSGYSFSCFNCDEESPEAEPLSEAEAIAGAEGWVLGLDPDTEHADAVYACSRCASLLVDPFPVKPLMVDKDS